jgi:hypothetical protein
VRIEPHLATKTPVVGEAHPWRETRQRRRLHEPGTTWGHSSGMMKHVPHPDRAEVDRTPRHPQPVTRGAAVVLGKELDVRPTSRATVARVASPSTVAGAPWRYHTASASERQASARATQLPLREGVCPIRTLGELGERVHTPSDSQILACRLAAIARVIFRHVDECTVGLE